MHKENDEQYVFHKCASCASVFLINRVPEEDLSRYYQESYLPYLGAAAWGKFSSFVEGSQRALDVRRVQQVARAMQGQKDFTLLDVGCGNPSFLKMAHEKLNIPCTGIDFSDSGWKHGAFAGIELIKTAVADYKPTRLFDVITLWHYLEHDYHLPETAEKLHKLLKPGGKLIIEVPDYNSVTARLQKQYWQGWHSPRHLTLFSKNGFRALFSEDKWSINKHLRYGTLDAFTLWWLGRMEQKQIKWGYSMEKEFWPLVLLKVISFPFFLFEKLLPMGIQLVVMEKK